MNARIQLASLLALLLTTACLPTLELKQPRSFTGRQVKRMQYEDACKLQHYFDLKPPQALILEERATSANSRTEAGTTRVLVRRGVQLQQLGRILKRYYLDVPQWLLRSDVTVKTDFLRRIPKPRKGKRSILQQSRGVVIIPTTATIIMEAGEQKVQVSYHPCLGELLFGHRTYKLRRLILHPVKGPRTRAIPVVRPAPKPRLRPVPRPRVRPDPRPALRPEPRPDPRPAPRPEPRRPGLGPLPR